MHRHDHRMEALINEIKIHPNGIHYNALEKCLVPSSMSRKTFANKIKALEKSKALLVKHGSQRKKIFFLSKKAKWVMQTHSSSFELLDSMIRGAKRLKENSKLSKEVKLKIALVEFGFDSAINALHRFYPKYYLSLGSAFQELFIESEIMVDIIMRDLLEGFIGSIRPTKKDLANALEVAVDFHIMGINLGYRSMQDPEIYEDLRSYEYYESMQTKDIKKDRKTLHPLVNEQLHEIKAHYKKMITEQLGN